MLRKVLWLGDTKEMTLIKKCRRATKKYNKAKKAYEKEWKKDQINMVLFELRGQMDERKEEMKAAVHEYDKEFGPLPEKREKE